MFESSTEDVEDDTINYDEVNESFYRGYQYEGNIYLEKVEKQIINEHIINENNEKTIIKAFDMIARKLKRGDKIEILPEFEKYGLNDEIIAKLGIIAIELAPRKISQKNSRYTTEDRYADDMFEDYENDFEDDDDKGRRMMPKYVEQEPINIRSKTAPASSEDAIPPLKFSTVQSGRNGGRFKTTAWIQKGQWKLGEKIGSGAFGDVYQGMSDDGYLFACKQLKIVDEKEIINLISEIELMQTFDHPNIVKYLGAKVDVDKGLVYIFQEWVPGGSLAHLLKRFGPFSVGVVRTYTHQILDGLVYLHEHGVVHRDIKGGNILVDDAGVVKLADFGASTTMAFGETVETTTIKGTPYFMAPEVLGESRYGRRGDVWAVGCTIIQMLTGEPPWKDRKPNSLIALHALISGWRGIPPMERDIPEDLHAFLELCFVKDFNFRPMPKTLLEHEFLNPSEDELSESLGGTNSNLREQLERAAARASFKPNDTFSDIDAMIAQKGQGMQPSAAPKSESEAASPNSSSPVRQSNSNPFARKSVGSPAPSPLNVSPSPAPVNPFAKGGVRSSGGRSSGLTISAAVGALTISPPSSASSVNGSARNGSDPAIIPPPTQSPLTTKSNASTPRLTEKQRSDRDAAHVRRGSGSSEDGTIKRITGSRERDKRIQHLTEDPDITPRSHHGTARTAISNSASTSNLPPTRFNFEEQEKKKRPGSGTEASHSSEASQPTQTSQFEKWRCENPKCLKWNAGNPDYCDFCAIRRGATGARGNAAKLYLDQHH